MGTNPKIPDSHQTIMPYLIVKDAQKFIAFTKNVFGASETCKFMRDESTILHAEIVIGNSTVMFADSTELFSEQTAGLFVYVEDADETYNKAIAEGATSVMEMSDKDYGRSGGVKDPFGNTWWVTSVL